MYLPNDFIDKVRKNFKEDAQAFFNFYELKPLKSIRVNTLKIEVEKFLKLFHFNLKNTGFSADSFFVNDNKFEPIRDKLGYMPLHHAGAFYVQEASATAPVVTLEVKKDDKVLDLCAAPGGKSTQIAALLNGTGLLWANDFVKNRAKTLLSNIERMGVKNAIVSSCAPDILCKKLSGFFDKVLVDAPCSGEGMFRKNPESVKEWSQEHVLSCAKRQKLILESAKHAVKENGVLVYSTCTFSPEENEEVICDFLNKNRDFELVDINCGFGRSAFSDYKSENADLKKVRRITPIEGGEGHFIAKMRKKGGVTPKIKWYNYKKENKSVISVKNILKEIAYLPIENRVEQFGNKFLMLPNNMPDLQGLNILRAGLLLAEEEKARVEPSHAFFMALKPNELRNKVSLSLEGEEILKFLRGEEIPVSKVLKGFAGVVIENEVVTGFGKCSNGVLKNRYPKGLRNKK